VPIMRKLRLYYPPPGRVKAQSRDLITPHGAQTKPKAVDQSGLSKQLDIPLFGVINEILAWCYEYRDCALSQGGYNVVLVKVSPQSKAWWGDESAQEISYGMRGQILSSGKRRQVRTTIEEKECA